MSGTGNSYLENKLKSLRGNNPQSSTIRSYSPSPYQGTTLGNTVSSSLGYTTKMDTFQPTFVNRDSSVKYQSVATPSFEPQVRSVSPIRIASTYQPTSTLQQTSSYNPIQVNYPSNYYGSSNPVTSQPVAYNSKPIYSAPLSSSNELKANPAIYSLMGYTPQVSSNGYAANSQPVSYTPTHSADDYRRMISSGGDAAVMDKLKGAILGITEDLSGGNTSALQDAIRGLRERLPREKETYANLENNSIDDLMTEERKKQELIQKIQEKEQGLRNLENNFHELERGLREVCSTEKG